MARYPTGDYDYPKDWPGNLCDWIELYCWYMIDLDEPVLPDDYPIYGDYLYVCDGKVYRSDWHGITVAILKRREGFSEVRRCDIVGRQK